MILWLCRSILTSCSNIDCFLSNACFQDPIEKEEMNKIQKKLDKLNEEHSSLGKAQVLGGFSRMKEIENGIAQLQSEMETKNIIKIEKLKKREIDLRENAKRIALDTDKFINIAIIGRSGVGKSMLLGGIVEKQIKCEIFECTQEMKAYPHPTCKYLMLWDVPGAGTPSHPTIDYFEKNLLFFMDYLLIVVTGRTVDEDSI